MNVLLPLPRKLYPLLLPIQDEEGNDLGRLCVPSSFPLASPISELDVADGQLADGPLTDGRAVLPFVRKPDWDTQVEEYLDAVEEIVRAAVRYRWTSLSELVDELADWFDEIPSRPNPCGSGASCGPNGRTGTVFAHAHAGRSGGRDYRGVSFEIHLKNGYVASIDCQEK